MSEGLQIHILVNFLPFDQPSEQLKQTAVVLIRNAYGFNERS
jgi:hypothetical protein